MNIPPVPSDLTPRPWTLTLPHRATRLLSPRWTRTVLATSLLLVVGSSALAQSSPAKKWAATWTSADVGAYTGGSGFPPLDLSLAFPNPSVGANEQTFRLIVKPDLWGKKMRFKFSNLYGTQPVTFGKIVVGLQEYGANIVDGTAVAVTFNGGSESVTIPAGEKVFSDTVRLPFVQTPNDQLLQGRNLAVSFYVQGQSGPMTWHAGAWVISYITTPGAGDHTQDMSGPVFLNTTSSWFFLDEVDVLAPTDTVVVCAFGDSITDGGFITVNGNDRWSDDLSRRLHVTYGNRVSVVNQGISGNTVTNPARSGPAAVDRLDSDVLSLSGLTGVVWLEGINDLSQNHPVADIIAGYQDVVARLHGQGVKVVGATVTSALNPGLTGSALASSQNREARRLQLNDFIRTSGIYDGVADMGVVTLDPSTGAMQKAFTLNSTTGAAPDFTHPSRAGHQAMADSIDISIFAPPAAAK